jgi:hypothetical protein
MAACTASAAATVEPAAATTNADEDLSKWVG